MTITTNAINYTVEELSIVLRVQDILLENRGSFEKHLMVPEITGLNSDLQKGLYTILQSYQHRVSMPDWTGVAFLGYSYEQLTTIKSYFARFNQALQLIAAETPKLKQSKVGEFQLSLIEMCLKGHLDLMAGAMKNTPWSQSIINLSIETTIQHISSIPNPVIGGNNGEMGLFINNPQLKNIAELVEDLVRDNEVQAAQIVDLKNLNQKLKEENELLTNRVPQLAASNLAQNNVLKNKPQHIKPFGQGLGLFPKKPSVSLSEADVMQPAVDSTTP